MLLYLCLLNFLLSSYAVTGLEIIDVLRDIRVYKGLSLKVENDQTGLLSESLRTKVLFNNDWTHYEKLKKYVEESILEITEKVKPLRRTEVGIIYVENCINNSYVMKTYENRYVKACKIGCKEAPFIPNTILRRCFLLKDDQKTIQVVDNDKPLAHSIDLMISVNLMKCVNSPVSYYASAVQVSFKDDRPEVGSIWLCSNNIQFRAPDRKVIKKIMMENVIHILGFGIELFSLFRDKYGAAQTPRDMYGDPRLGSMDYLNFTRVPKPANSVLKRIIRNETFPSGVREVERYMLTTPYLREASRKFHNCKSIEGVFLENLPEPLVYLNYFEKRIFNNEIMVFPRVKSGTVSLFTVALLKDTGWYNPSSLDRLTDEDDEFQFGKNMGCEFLNFGCLDYINFKRNSGSSTSPFCTKCDEKIDKCALAIVPDNGVKDKDVLIFDGNKYYPDESAEYCPIRRSDYRGYREDLKICEQICLGYASSKHYSIPNKFGCKYLKEFRGSWTKKSCTQNNTVQIKPYDITSENCLNLRFRCSNYFGLLVEFNNEIFPCDPSRQLVHIETIVNGGIVAGNYRCPSCQEICKDKCPKKPFLYSKCRLDNNNRCEVDPYIYMTCRNEAKPIYQRTIRVIDKCSK